MESNQIGPINIGNPIEYTMIELAQIISKLIENKLPNYPKIQFIYKDLPSDDPKKRKPDITKAKQFLNWQPIIDIQTGLSHTVDYFIHYLGLHDKEQHQQPQLQHQQEAEHENDHKFNDKELLMDEID